MATAMEVARYLIAKRDLTGDMQLEKLLYYAQAWSLAWTGNALFGEEIEAWSNGPVVRSVWAAKKYGDIEPDAEAIRPDERAIVDAVWAYYGDKGGRRLSRLTHQEDPWKEARRGLAEDARSTSPISRASMLRYYTAQAARAAAGAVPVAPVLSEAVSDADVLAVGNRQRTRWRKALDALAQR